MPVISLAILFAFPYLFILAFLILSVRHLIDHLRLYIDFRDPADRKNDKI